MKAIIKVYSKFNQSKLVNKETKERVRSIAEKTHTTLEYVVNPKLAKGRQLSAVTMFVSNVIGARYKAVIAANKKLAAKLFFEITLDGEIYRSETALVKAGFTSLVTVSLASLKKMPISEVIGNVSATQTTALSVASTYLADVADIAKMVDDTIFPKDAGKDLASMKVEPSGDLVAVD